MQKAVANWIGFPNRASQAPQEMFTMSFLSRAGEVVLGIQKE